MSTDITSTDSSSNSLPSGTQSTGLNPNPSVYQSLISPRSRRLRTTGIVLLVAIVLMATYGVITLMPSLYSATHRLDQIATDRLHQNSAMKTVVVSETVQGSVPLISFSGARMVPPTERLRPNGLTEHEHKEIVAQLLFAYGYWTLCGGLIIGLIVVCWLDFRELARNYDAERHRIYVASLVNRGETTIGEPGSE